ncbi:hypothetical protein [Pseudomonas sp. RIT411]|uniref:hypothetical protein n=1 Tax=Pseudomonas sp. RIT411 TaxID=2202160 RepID=UPI000D387EE4|nr:hypothetical protein [Pseudomonas sp. RIT 411]RAU39273.1 hypothetical protein DBY63_012400 [Pseudomonas sp. RIT 411]
MRNRVERMSLCSYVQAFFPMNFDVTLDRSDVNPDHRVLTVRDAVTHNTAVYEGPLLAIIDICSMGDIAARMCSQLAEQATGPRKSHLEMRQRA